MGQMIKESECHDYDCHKFNKKCTGLKCMAWERQLKKETRCIDTKPTIEETMTQLIEPDTWEAEHNYLGSRNNKTCFIRWVPSGNGWCDALPKEHES